MNIKSLLLLVSLAAGLPCGAAANDVIYQTGFEPPGFTVTQPLRGQENWVDYGNGEEIAVSTENPRDGAQCLRWKGLNLGNGQTFGGTACFQSILDATAANPPMLIDIRADVRMDGPQTGTLGTPAQDILSANLFAVVLQPNGFGRVIGGFFLSSGGQIWTFGSRQEDRYRYSTPATLGAYHSLRIRVDFFGRKLIYIVDGIELGSAPIDPSILSERLVGGYMEVFGPNAPINTPDLTYDRANYTAYFDNYSLESVPLTPDEVAIQFAVTD
jgi:hypothetical protein